MLGSGIRGRLGPQETHHRGHTEECLPGNHSHHSPTNFLMYVEGPPTSPPPTCILQCWGLQVINIPPVLAGHHVPGHHVPSCCGHSSVCSILYTLYSLHTLATLHTLHSLHTLYTLYILHKLATLHTLHSLHTLHKHKGHNVHWTQLRPTLHSTRWSSKRETLS